MGFTVVPDRAAGYALAETDWDASIKGNLNTGTIVQLASSKLTVAAASFDFTSISSSFSHLHLMAYLRGTDASFTVGARMRFNNDSAANYDYQTFYAGTTIPAATETFAASFIYLALAPGASAGASLYSAHALTIPNYANAANNKVALVRNSLKDAVTSGSLQVARVGGFWRSNAAITRITVLPSAGNWAAGSRISLYGIA